MLHAVGRTAGRAPHSHWMAEAVLHLKGRKLKEALSACFLAGRCDLEDQHSADHGAGGQDSEASASQRVTAFLHSKALGSRVASTPMGILLFPKVPGRASASQRPWCPRCSSLQRLTWAASAKKKEGV